MDINNYISLENKTEDAIKAVASYFKNNTNFVAKMRAGVEENLTELANGIKSIKKADVDDSSATEAINHKLVTTYLVYMNKSKSDLSKKDDKYVLPFEDFLKFAKKYLNDTPGSLEVFNITNSGNEEDVEKDIEKFQYFWKDNSKKNEGQISDSYEMFHYLNGDQKAIGIHSSGKINRQAEIKDKFLFNKKDKIVIEYKHNQLEKLSELLDVEYLTKEQLDQLETIDKTFKAVEKDFATYPASEKEATIVNENEFAISKLVSNRVIVELNILEEANKMINTTK